MPSISATANGWPRAAAARKASRAAGPLRDGDRPGAPARQDLLEDQAVGGVVVHDQDRQPFQPGNVRLDAGDDASCGLDAQHDREPNVLPRPGSLSTQIRPPISSTSLAEIVRPRPVPPNRRVVEPSACSNGSKIVSQLLGGDADPRVGDGEAEDDSLDRPASSSDNGDDDLAPLGELDGVADQVDQDLAQPAGVADQSVGDLGRDPAGQLQPLGVCPQRQGLERLVAARRAGRTGPGRGSACRPRSWRSRGCR